jgi:hypothetical protein
LGGGTLVSVSLSVTSCGKKTKYIFGAVPTSEEKGAKISLVTDLNGKSIDGYTLYVNKNANWNDKLLPAGMIAGGASSGADIFSTSQYDMSAIVIDNGYVTPPDVQDPNYDDPTISFAYVGLPFTTDDPFGISSGILDLKTLDYEQYSLCDPQTYSWTKFDDEGD